MTDRLDQTNLPNCLNPCLTEGMVLMEISIRSTGHFHGSAPVAGSEDSEGVVRCSRDRETEPARYV